MPTYIVKLFGQVTAQAEITVEAASRAAAGQLAHNSHDTLEWSVDGMHLWDSAPENPEIESIDLADLPAGGFAEDA